MQMSDSGTTVSGGIGFPGALFIAFLVLKLTGVINWSWWWVTSPLWISWSMLLAVLLFIVVLTWMDR
jgi:phosphoglycerol transferase MdoB-like AlkP superfamily enzyme